MFFDSMDGFLDLPPGQMKLTLRGLRSLVSLTERSNSEVFARLIHASFRDFLLDSSRAKDYHVDSEGWICTMFCRAFALASRDLFRSLESHNCASQPLKGPSLTSSIWYQRHQQTLGNHAYFDPCDIGLLPGFLMSSFKLSSRKDLLVNVVRESLKNSPFSSYLMDVKVHALPFDIKIWLLDPLVTIIRPKILVSITFS